MTVNGALYTQHDIACDKVFTFPKGIPGFETYTKFHIFHKQENDLTAYWLESLDNPKLTFTLVDPAIYDLEYELHLSDGEQKLIQAKSADTCAVFLVLSKRPGSDGTPASLKANIAGPLIINVEDKIGLQKVMVRSQDTVCMFES